MSFRCQNCKQVVAHNTPQALVVVQTRVKNYQNILYDFAGKERGHKDTVGSEIVKEIPVCPSCELKLTGKCSTPLSSADTFLQKTNTSVLPKAYKTSVPVEHVTLPPRTN